MSVLSQAAQACKQRIQELEAKTVQHYKSEILAAARKLQVETEQSSANSCMYSSLLPFVVSMCT